MSVELKVCKGCGWYSGFTHTDECDPKLGKIADELSAALPQFKPTKLGYGFGKLTFELSENLHVTFSVHRDREYTPEIWNIESVDGERAVALVKHLHDWMNDK